MDEGCKEVRLSVEVFTFRECGGPKSLGSFWSKIRQNTTFRESSSYLLV